jgi:hypothetical protein
VNYLEALIIMFLLFNFSQLLICYGLIGVSSYKLVADGFSHCGYDSPVFSVLDDGYGIGWTGRGGLSVLSTRVWSLYCLEIGVCSFCHFIDLWQPP